MDLMIDRQAEELREAFRGEYVKNPSFIIPGLAGQDRPKPENPRPAAGTTKGKSNMRIGKLEKKSNKNGEYFNLELRIPFLPATDLYGKLAEQKSGNSPFLQFYWKGYQCGAAWKKQTDDGRDYLSVQVESPILPDGKLTFFIWKDDESGEAFASIPINPRNSEKESAEANAPAF